MCRVDQVVPAGAREIWEMYLPPSTTARLAVEFGPHTDPTSPYMFHCHMLEHEDNGIMGRFVLVEPGTEHLVPAAWKP